MITYRKGDATSPVGDGPKYIIHVCNSVGGWGAGFVLALSKKWPEPEAAYRDWYRSKKHPMWGDFKLGNIQIVKVANELSVINMIAQEGYGKNNRNLHKTSEADSKPPIRYDALEDCLSKVAGYAREYGVSVHGPRFGSGLSGGNWGSIELIVNRTLAEVPVTIYAL